MPMSIAALTRQAISAAISSRPKSASSVFGSRRLPSVTVVAGFGTMMPGVAESDQRDEQPDARGHGGVKLVRDRGDDQLPHADQR